MVPSGNPKALIYKDKNNLKGESCLTVDEALLAWGARGRRFESFHTDQ